MFTLQQIESAHQRTTSGSDFPQYIRDIKTFGVLRFQTFVSDCHTVYFGSDDSRIESAGKYATLEVSETYDKLGFEKGLKDNQEGRNDFFQFCQICAITGVASWVMDLVEMKCIYYNGEGTIVLIESVST